MVRETSLEAYEDALQSGHINETELKLIRWLKEYAEEFSDAPTQKEFLMFYVSAMIGSDSWENIQDYQKCISSLRKKKVIYDLEKRPCLASKSNHKAYPIVLSGLMPQKIERILDSKEIWVITPTGSIDLEWKGFRKKHQALEYKLQHGGNLHKVILT